MPSAGQQFGQYRLIRQIGEGGMATVYLAEDDKHGRQVAIKFVKSGTTDAARRGQFQRETEITSRLTHPHIIPLHDSGVIDGQPFYVMPYIDGESLRARLRQQGRLPFDDVLRLAREVAGALDHAHAQGLVHRDIKPENILLSHGIALVADFGVARPAREDVAAAETRSGGEFLSSAGMAIGTPEYMAPEQVLGDADVDGRADLYAFGCVVFEMLAGQPPFAGPTSTAVLMRHLNETAPSLATLSPGVPPAAAAAIERALAKSPADRFPSVMAFVAALGSAEAAAVDRITGGPSAVLSTGVTIAVLPFQPIGSADEVGYLSDGICDELIHALGRLEGVRVIARGSSFLFREGRPDVRAIGAQLRVGLLVDGTLRRVGRRLRLTAQLINAADGFQLWSERYDRELDDVFALEDDLSGAISSVLKERLTGGPARSTQVSGGAVRPASVDAYEPFLMGRQHWNRRTPPDLARAVEHFGVSVQIDPAFGAAWGGMALCYVTQHIYGLRQPDEAIELARAAVQQGLRVDPRQVEALTAAACLRAVYDWDFAAAEQDFRRCLDVDPSNATGHQWHAMNLLAPLGRFDEARAALQQARLLDPLSPSVAASLGFVSYLERDDERAVDWYHRALTLDPTFAAASYFLGLALAAAGRLGEATEVLETAVTGMARSSEVVAALAAVHAERGDRTQAVAMLQELEQRGVERYVSPALTAIVRFALGDRDAAFADLERAVAVRAIEVLWLDVRPTFASLRSEPRFQALRARRAAGRRTLTR